MRTILIFALTIGAALGAGFHGSAFTMDAIPNWYATLEKPSFNPPNWIFGPVWTTLYILMGIAAGLVWKRGGSRSRVPLIVYFVHLAVNAFWSIAFFGMESPEVALGVIAVLWAMIVWLIVMFARHSRTAALLLVPYLAWVSFASVLNVAIVILN